MPRMSKKRKQEWALFLNERNRIIYNDFAENAVVNVSRVFAVLWCIAKNIYREGEQRTMKMIENEMNVTVHLEIIKASEIEPKEVKWLWYPYILFGKVTLLQGDPGNGTSKLMLSIAALLSNGERLKVS